MKKMRWPLQKKNAEYERRMQRRVESLTRADLEKLSEQPNTVVYEPTHTMTYEPWSADKVEEYVRKIVSRCMQNEGESTSSIQKDLTNDTGMCEFAARYKTFFEKLTDPVFAADKKHVRMITDMLNIRRKVEEKKLSEQDAKVQCADAALSSLVTRTL